MNLGSQSSKCTEIRTPQDPDKISMIDNKRMSIGIGVIGGLVSLYLIKIIQKLSMEFSSIVSVAPFYSRDQGLNPGEFAVSNSN